MGQKIQLTETFTGSGLTVLYNDTIMSSGSLLLMDLGHSLGGFSGVPVNGSVIPNVAWQVANGLVSGAPGQTALGIPVYGTSAAAPSYPLIERTTKLGLHAIRSQANDVSAGAFALKFPTAVDTYIQSNTAHSFYVSIWDNVTRAFTTAASPYPGISIVGNGSANAQYVVQPGTNQVTVGTSLGLSESRNYLTTGTGLLQFGFTGVAGTISAYNDWLYMFGGTGGAFSGLHVGGSQIIYRIYVEDLTVSGRTYATVAALDSALYATAFASGGKFYSDSYTSPSGYP